MHEPHTPMLVFLRNVIPGDKVQAQRLEQLLKLIYPGIIPGWTA